MAGTNRKGLPPGKPLPNHTNPAEILRPVADMGNVVPPEVRAAKHWCCWKAVWSEKRGKFDKIPTHPRGHGISTKTPAKWVSFDAALAAYRANPVQFSGIGCLMDPATDLVGIDLDKCVTDGVPAPWAQAIIDQTDSYAELSPSGKGLRIFVQGEIAADLANNAVGIEVYAGHGARFLTVTGRHLGDAPKAIRATPDALVDIFTRYAKATPSDAAPSKATMPAVLDADVLLDPRVQHLPEHIAEFLQTGETTETDRSLAILKAAIYLHHCRLNEAEVFSHLVHSDAVMDIALDKRHQNRDRALEYLWKEHAQKAKAKAGSPVSSPDEFEDISTPEEKAEKPKAKRSAFEFVPAGDLLFAPPPVTYLIEELFEAGAMGLLFAPPSSAKSFLALDWAASIATGTPWLGREVTQGTVFYLAGEGHAGISRRLRAWEIAHGVSLAAAPLFVSKVPAALMDKAGANAVRDAALAMVKAHGPAALVIVDTLARNMGSGDESSNSDIGTFVNRLDGVRAALGSGVLTVHHTGHTDGERARGASALPAAMDTIFRIDKKDTLLELCHLKSKETELHRSIVMRLETVPLPGWLDRHGELMTSAVISDITPGDEFDAPSLSVQQTIAVQALREAGAPQTRGEWRKAFGSLRDGTAETKRKAFDRSVDDLTRMGLVHQVAGRYCLTEKGGT